MEIDSSEAMIALGASVGSRINRGGIAIELIGDVGAGKTTFVKGLAQGLEISDDVQSPSFTISREYQARNGLRLVHYDFYRLDDAGVMTDEVKDAVGDPMTIVVVEWSAVVKDVLPINCLQVTLQYSERDGRYVTFAGDAALRAQLVEGEPL